eukprot:12914339-Alexandrium_andersonii.AAC.1
MSCTPSCRPTGDQQADMTDKLANAHTMQVHARRLPRLRPIARPTGTSKRQGQAADEELIME